MSVCWLSPNENQMPDLRFLTGQVLPVVDYDILLCAEQSSFSYAFVSTAIPLLINRLTAQLLVAMTHKQLYGDIPLTHRPTITRTGMDESGCLANQFSLEFMHIGTLQDSTPRIAQICSVARSMSPSHLLFCPLTAKPLWKNAERSMLVSYLTELGLQLPYHIPFTVNAAQ